MHYRKLIKVKNLDWADVSFELRSAGVRERGRTA